MGSDPAGEAAFFLISGTLGRTILALSTCGKFGENGLAFRVSCPKIDQQTKRLRWLK
jgi:hypothetical protein